MRSLFLFFFITTSLLSYGQDVRSFSFFGGVNMPITIDEGLLRDPRFRNKLTFRGVPAGLSYGYEYNNRLGFLISLSYSQIGEQQLIRNITGGDVGIRDIRMDYIALPIAFKLYLTRLAFIRLNLIASVNFAYLVNGQETLSFSPSILEYPSSVRIPTSPGYEVRSDGGVATPGANNEVQVSNDKYNKLQIFPGLGLRLEAGLNEKWSINLDVRFHYGIFDSRTEEYKTQLSQPTEAPDLGGRRHDLYLSIELGISRLIQIKIRRQAVKTSNEPIKKMKFKRPKW